MIQNDNEKGWLQPLLDIRNQLDLRNDYERRDFRRLTGKLQLVESKVDGTVVPIAGPYTKEWRERWLRQVLSAQQEIRAKAPNDMKDIELISIAELHKIRQIWLEDKHEFDDALPRIYQDTTGEPFPSLQFNTDQSPLGAEEWSLLQDICAETNQDDLMHFELITRLLSTEQQYQTHARRVGIFKALESCFESSSRSKDNAIANAKAERKLKKDIESIRTDDKLESVKQTLSDWAAIKFGKRVTKE